MSSGEVQAVLFDTSIWTAPAARAWLAPHGFVPIKRVHRTKNYLRYRLAEPGQYVRKRTLTLGEPRDAPGIKFILGWRA